VNESENGQGHLGWSSLDANLVSIADLSPAAFVCFMSTRGLSLEDIKRAVKEELRRRGEI
jgi:hypothetical protein